MSTRGVRTRATCTRDTWVAASALVSLVLFFCHASYSTDCLVHDRNSSVDPLRWFHHVHFACAM
eukprot:595514-Pyramimonas_sp.AAC.2